MIEILIDSVFLRIDDRNSHRFRFSSEESIIALKNSSHVCSLFSEEL